MAKLDGLRVVVTRAAHQAEELAAPLRALGAEVVLLPVIDIAPPLDSMPLKEAAARIDEYDWLVFTSANAVQAFASQAPVLSKPRIAAVGSATRIAAEQAGFAVDVVPEKYVAESLAEALRSENLSQSRILIPSAAITRDVVPTALRRLGAKVDVVEAYRNVIPPEAIAFASEVFLPPYPDWVTFASSSAVVHLVQLIGLDRLRHSKILTIGPITSNTVRKYGASVTTEAIESNARGMIDALLSFLA